MRARNPARGRDKEELTEGVLKPDKQVSVLGGEESGKGGGELPP